MNAINPAGMALRHAATSPEWRPFQERSPVDVVIPCYNQGPLLAQAIDSVLSQTYSEVGVIVVDDGSTDDTPAVAARYGDRVQYRRKPNAGLAAARNTGLLAARGEFVLFLDSDDFLQPDTLEQQMRAAAARPAGAVFYGACQQVDHACRPLGGPSFRDLGDDPFHALLAGNCFPCPNMVVVRRQAFANVGLFDAGMPSGAEDWEMWLRLAAAGFEFVAVPEAIAMYRRYPGSMSHNYARMARSAAFVVERGRRYHKSCALCRKVGARGRRLAREWHLDSRIAAVRQSRADGGLRAGIAQAARLAAQNPTLWPRLLTEFRRYRRARKKAAPAELAGGADFPVSFEFTPEILCLTEEF